MASIDTLSGGNIEPRALEDEMRSAYLDYAMSVIVGRALPDVRDGLKPVHRRVLFSMSENGLTPTRPYRKCASVVGDVMGNYHPHGDSAIYDALARLAQEFSMRYELVDGQGNFGSIDDDPPAAMRYCVVGDTRVATPDGTVRIADLADGFEPDSERDVDLWCTTGWAGPCTHRRSFTPATTRRCGCARARATRSRARTTTRSCASSTWSASRCCCGSSSTRSRPVTACSSPAPRAMTPRNSTPTSAGSRSCWAHSSPKASPTRTAPASTTTITSTSTGSSPHTTGTSAAGATSTSARSARAAGVASSTSRT